MLVSCIGFTKDIENHKIQESYLSFLEQDYKNSQLIIINNKSTLSECLQLELPYSDRLCIIDRPGQNMGESLAEAWRAAGGQMICNFPLNFRHLKHRISHGIQELANNNAVLVAPKTYEENGNLIESTHGIVPELSIFHFPSIAKFFNLEYGVWWQYVLFLSEFDQDIYTFQDPLVAIKL